MNVITSIRNYFIEAIGEIRKVIWPSRKQTVNYTILVIVLSLAIAIFFGVLDYIFTFGLGQIIK
jgi:preprotein translocase subunit SecE